MNKKITFLQRLGLKIFAWVLKSPAQSKTAPVNSLIYERGFYGRKIATPLTHPQISVGEHTYGLRRECFFSYHPEDRVVIGKFCSIADGVKFVFGNHATDRVATFPLRALFFGGKPFEDSLSKGNITIGHDVWIGADALILSGVSIGHGSIVAAGSVVSKNVAPYTVVGGVPARPIKKRLSDSQIKSLLEIQWWNWPLEKIRAEEKTFYKPVDEFIKSQSSLNR